MFNLLQQFDDFVVIDKYPNVSVHKDEGDTMLLQEVARQIGHDKLYLVHRLDKMTSGILLLAKSSQAASQISALFAQREIDKYYLAIGGNKPKKKQGTITGDMQRTRRSAWKLSPKKTNPAITQFFSLAGEEAERLYLCKPYTGKTHQIRVALNALGASILGDSIYSPSLKADRGYLHAYAIRFTLNGIQFQFICPPNKGAKWQSEKIENALTKWNSPWDLPWPKIR